MQPALNQNLDRSAAQTMLPLSVAQTDVWRAQKLAPASPFFNIGGYVEIRGSVDPKVFEAAVGRALEDSDSLRFRFVETEHGPGQVRAAVGQLEIPTVDLAGTVDSHAAALAWMQADMDKPFDLSNGALYRFALLKLSDNRTL